MNDHNLDDLIIDNIEPKNSKTKSFLTIIALLIIVLIVAIILTKIILKNPDADRLALEENSTELISPKLTLQNTTKKVKRAEPKAPTSTAVKKPSVSKLVEEKIAAPTISITKKPSPKPKVITKPKPIIKEKIEKTPIKPNVLPEESNLVNTNAHYIQVGSFSKTPSARFLSVITNSGFNYKITSSSNNGIKKLLIGPYENKKTANTALVRVKDRINKSAFVIKK